MTALQFLLLAACLQSAPMWEDPTVNAVNRLGARSIVVPCADRETATAIARLEKPREASQYLMSLNGDWRMKVGELNPNNYINPCEQGYRTGTTRLEVGGVTVETCGEPFGFNVWPWSQEELERAKHVEDLVEHDVLTVNIDAAQMGIGGDNSWRARPHDEHLLKPGREYCLSFVVRR